MKQGKLELFVGGFVLLGLAAIAFLAVKLGAGSFVGTGHYLLEARFDSASGLRAGCSVHVAGVPVGRVESIRVDPGDFSAIVTMSVLAGLNLPKDSMASIKSTGLIGDKHIVLSPGSEAENLTPGERITMTESSVDIESLIGKMAFGTVDKGGESTKDGVKQPAP